MKLLINGDTARAADVETRLVQLQDALAGVVGHVYVISNIGTFGPGVVKIGMTRRLDPDERIRELGDASVPFRFDTHALIFSDDAVALEGIPCCPLRVGESIASTPVGRSSTPIRPRYGISFSNWLENICWNTGTLQRALKWRASGALPLPTRASSDVSGP